MKLKGKVAVVTGAGSGIGKAIAMRFAAEGAHVVVADVVPARLQAVAAEISAAGGSVVAVVADVSKLQDVEQMIDTAVSNFGRLDVLTNNAGIMDGVTPVADVSDDLWDRVIGINLNGAFYACRKAVPIMLKQGGGSIINTASISGIRGGMAGAAYTASKHAVVGLTKNIAQFYAREGIRCNAICPGQVKTAIVQGVEPHLKGYAKQLKVKELSPRVAEPEEIATVALFLASDDSSFVNGLSLVADGGWTAV